MELTYKFLYNQNAKEALEKLYRTNFDGKTSYNIGRILNQCSKNFNILKSEFQIIVDKHSEKDEKGKLLTPDGDGSFKLQKDKVQDYQKEMQELMEKKFTLEKCSKINVGLLLASQDLKLSAINLDNLEPILEGLELI